MRQMAAVMLDTPPVLQCATACLICSSQINSQGCVVQREWAAKTHAPPSIDYCRRSWSVFSRVSSSPCAQAMIEARIAKATMVGSLAIFALLVTFDNLTDYDTNYAFVRHVLSMDTTFPGNALLYRRITSPALWQAGYALIIAGEGLTGIALAVATISLALHLRSDGGRFNRAKRFTIIGAVIGFLVWFFGFMVVGGEWYSMWQSPMWNGQEPAFRFYVTILAVLIFVNQPDADLAASGGGSPADDRQRGELCGREGHSVRR